MDKRRNSQVERRFKFSHMPDRQTFDEFDFGFNPTIPKRRIMELATKRFVAQTSNILLIGPPGVGKRWLNSPTLYPEELFSRS